MTTGSSSTVNNLNTSTLLFSVIARFAIDALNGDRYHVTLVVRSANRVVYPQGGLLAQGRGFVTVLTR